MQQQTSEQIRARLAEITKAQAVHEARDFDAEMLAIMQDGGNVDALEDQQLDAERTARRLRVEHQALNKALPEAERQEAEQELAQVKAEMADQPKRIQDLATQAESLVKKLAPLLSQIQATHRERVLSHNKALQVVRSKKLPDELLADTGAITCPLAQGLMDQLKSAMGHGINLGDRHELMAYTTGFEFTKYETRI